MVKDNTALIITVIVLSVVLVSYNILNHIAKNSRR